MAIRFVDKDAGDGKAETAKPARATAPRHAPASPDMPPEDAASSDEPAELPGLPHAKPEPKQKGRKTPMSAAKAVGTATSTEAAAPGAEAEALLPGLQVHAKPTPKPRGRKKAFG